MSLSKIIAWCILNGEVHSQHSFIDNFKRQSTLWYIDATFNGVIMSFNYRKYGERCVLYRSASILKDGRVQNCDTVTELKEALL